MSSKMLSNHHLMSKKMEIYYTDLYYCESKTVDIYLFRSNVPRSLLIPCRYRILS